MQEQEQELILGIDIGASGIKGAIVDIHTGKLQNERMRLVTPDPATPEAMAETFAELVNMHKWKGLVGCGFPSIIKNGVAHSAANISKRWINQDVEKMLSNASGCKVKVLNDADAAGIAEMRFGLGQGEHGLVVLITIGSGLGSAIFLNGELVPNTELGHMFLHGDIAERYASNNTRKRENLGWDEWGERFNEYLEYVNHIFSPDLILLGGGVSKKFLKYRDHFTVDVKVTPAQLLNAAGTIGAAMYAYEMSKK